MLVELELESLLILPLNGSTAAGREKGSSRLTKEAFF
jgi:hypothetical protein